MVTLITEQLHKQSLEDPYQKAFSFNVNVPLPVVGSSPTVSLSTYGSTPEGSLAAYPSCKTHLLTASSALPRLPVPVGEPLYQTQTPSASVTNLSFPGSPPPPPKRHCRSLSVPEDLSCCRSTWRPSASRVWTPVRHRCQSGSAASLVSAASGSLPLCGRSSSVTASSLHSSCSPMFVSLALNPDSPVPWSFPWDPCDTLRGACSTFLPAPSSCSSSPAPPASSRSLLRRRFSLSPVHTQGASLLLRRPPREAPGPAAALSPRPATEQPALPPSPSSACSTPSSSRRVPRPALPRCHSQPCDMRRPYRKRRHDPDILPCSRPGLDFSKMTQIGTGESLGAGTNVSVLARPAQGERLPAFSPAELLGRSSIGPLSESEEDNNKRTGSLMDGGNFFERDCTELDLNLIEEN
ncbi:unnamed protein product [Arctogadus glacialis]